MVLRKLKTATSTNWNGTAMSIDLEKRSRMEARVAKLRAERENPLTLLHAVQRNDLRSLDSVLINDFNRNGQDELGVTPLVEAIINKNYEITHYLLKNGIDPNYVTNMNYTALSLLLYNIESEMTLKDIRLVLLLLRYGAKTSIPTTHQTADEYLKGLGYVVDGIYLRKYFAGIK